VNLTLNIFLRLIIPFARQKTNLNDVLRDTRTGYVRGPASDEKNIGGTSVSGCSELQFTRGSEI